jgi:hypothetical protein
MHSCVNVTGRVGFQGYGVGLEAMPMVRTATKKPWKHSTSGSASNYQGVHFSNGTWQAWHGRVYLGRFATEKGAALAMAQAQNPQSKKPKPRKRRRTCAMEAKVGLFQALYPLYKGQRFQADLDYTWAQLSTWLKHCYSFHGGSSM